jgi:hypothetical protein
MLSLGLSLLDIHATVTMLVAKTSTPSLANTSQPTRPIPEAAAVISANFPDNRMASIAY